MIFIGVYYLISFSYAKIEHNAIYKSNLQSIKEQTPDLLADVNLECPAKKDGYDEISSGLDNTSGGKYYVCKKQFYKEISGMDLVVCIYSCTFARMQTTVHAIHISVFAPLQDLQASDIFEIINCNFIQCSSGGISFASKDESRFINITGCRFEECSLSSNFEQSTATRGTAIDYRASYGIIQYCTFLNNDASRGGDIHYYFDFFKSNQYSLTIKDNTFQRLSSQFSNGALVCIGQNMCNFNFNNNQIIMHDSVNIPVFDSYSQLNDLSGCNIGENSMYPLRPELIATDNVPSLKGDSVKNGFKEGPVFEFKCPSEADYDIVLPSEEEEEFTDKRILACDKTLSKPIKTKNCILNIRYCTFNEFISNAISIALIGSSLPEEKTAICYCTFSNCKRASIDIQTEGDSSFFEIVNCTFELCNVTSGASAIHFKAANGKIEKCHFYNNQCMEEKGDIIYFPSIVASKEDNKLTITNNTFERSDDEYGKGSFFYYQYDEKSKLDFNYNKFIVHIGLSMCLFDCETKYITYTDWHFNKNCMQPYREEVILSENAINLPVDYFDLCNKNKCSELAEKYNDSDVYFFACGSPFESTQGITIDSAIVAIFYCTFNNVQSPDYKIGAIYISIENEDPNNKEPMRIYNCDFSSCYAENGGAIYIQSRVSSRLYEIQDCNFYNILLKGGDNNDIKGGAIYINAERSSFKIVGCTFEKNSAGKGAGIYYEYNSQNSLLEDTPNEEFKYSLYISNCKFNENTLYANGGGVFISIINGEPLKPIEIENCEFARNSGKDSDEEVENGGGIYYSFSSSSSSSSTLLESTDYSLHVFNCIFTGNKVGSNGGAICISITNGKPSNSIEINNCTFTQNKAKNTGSDIYYSLDSLSKNNNNYAFHVIDCHFSYSESGNQGGSSIFLSVQKDETPKNVEIIGCSFYYCISSKFDAICISSNNPSCLFHIDDCEFEGASTIRFNAISGTIEKCRFIDIGSEITYNSIYDGQLTDSQCLTIDHCTFKQSEKLDYIMFIVQDKSSNFRFTNNEINITNDKTRVFDIEAYQDGIGKWYFNNNAIDPQTGELIKTERAQNLQFPPSCSNGFLCSASSSSEEEESSSLEVESSSLKDSSSSGEESSSLEVESSSLKESSSSGESSSIEESSSDEITSLPAPDLYPGTNCEKNNRCFINGTDLSPSYIDISLSQFESLEPPPKEDGGGAIHLINYGIRCDDVTTFNNCTSSSRGGGGIYIHFDRKLETAVYIQNITFTNCKAVYGGAIYIYSSHEDNDIQIISCTFITNSASKYSTNKDHLYGGSAIYMTSVSCNVMNCNFVKNIGAAVKINNRFEKSVKSIKIKEESSFVSIKHCSFEIDEKASSSILYIYGDENEVPYNVNDCIFTGKLPKGSHHISGVSLSEKKKIPKIHISSCKFSSDKESAFNFKMNDSLSLLSVFDPNSQEFHFEEKKNDDSNASYSEKINLLYSLFLVITCGAAFLAFVIFEILKKDYINENGNVIEINFA